MNKSEQVYKATEVINPLWRHDHHCHHHHNMWPPSRCCRYWWGKEVCCMDWILFHLGTLTGTLPKTAQSWILSRKSDVKGNLGNWGSFQKFSNIFFFFFTSSLVCPVLILSKMMQSLAEFLYWMLSDFIGKLRGSIFVTIVFFWNIYH